MRTPSTLRRVVFSALTVLLVLGALEVGVRLLSALRTGPRALTYGLAADRETMNLDLHDEDQGGYSRYRPHQELLDENPDTGERIRPTINAQGFRGTDFGPKAPGVARVVALGASSTFGYHNRDGETWPARLEAELNGGGRPPGAGAADGGEGGDDADGDGSDTPNTAARRWEVLNLGIPHLTSSEILALFRAEALPRRPDVVVFYEGANDATPRRERFRVRRTLRRADALRTVYRFARDHSLLVAFLDSTLRPRLRSFDAAAVAEHRAGRATEFLASLEAMRRACEERGLAFVVVTQQACSLAFPREEMRGLGYAEEQARVAERLERDGELAPPAVWFLAHGDLMAAERDWAERHGVPLADGIAATDPRRDTLLSWVHLSPEGNARLAEAIAPVVRAAVGAP